MTQKIDFMTLRLKRKKITAKPSPCLSLFPHLLSLSSLGYNGKTALASQPPLPRPQQRKLSSSSIQGLNYACPAESRLLAFPTIMKPRTLLVSETRL